MLTAQAKLAGGILALGEIVKAMKTTPGMDPLRRVPDSGIEVTTSRALGVEFLRPHPHICVGSARAKHTMQCVARRTTSTWTNDGIPIRRAVGTV